MDKKNRNPIFYKNVEEMNKPISELINEIRNELSRTRGKLHDIKFTFGYEECIEIYVGGLTCVIAAIYEFQDELKKIENKKNG